MKLKPIELIILGLLLLGLCLWAFWPKPEGSLVTVTVDGSEEGTYSLVKDAVVPVDGFGEFSLTLVIKDGQAFVKNATCPDLICQEHTPISRAGELIVCLPGRVVITVTGEEAEYDAVIG